MNKLIKFPRLKIQTNNGFIRGRNIQIEAITNDYGLEGIYLTIYCQETNGEMREISTDTITFDRYQTQITLKPSKDTRRWTGSVLLPDSVPKSYSSYFSPSWVEWRIEAQLRHDTLGVFEEYYVPKVK